jgi:hypothetical protein
MIVTDDRPRGDGSDRYAIYSVVPQWDRTDEVGEHVAGRKRLAETSLQGIGSCLVTLRNEGQLTNDSRVGILDRLDRTWIVNPWAVGSV